MVTPARSVLCRLTHLLCATHQPCIAEIFSILFTYPGKPRPPNYNFHVIFSDKSTHIYANTLANENHACVCDGLLISATGWLPGGSSNQRSNPTTERCPLLCCTPRQRCWRAAPSSTAARRTLCAVLC